MDDLQLLLHETEPGVLVLALSGEVDMASAPTLKSATRTAVDSGQYRCLIFDLTNLQFIDSSGLHVLVESKRRMAEAGGDVKVVVDPAHNIARLLEITGLQHILNVAPNRDVALAHAA